MIKNLTILELEKNGKKYPLYLENSVTYAELFDISYVLRQFAIDGINKMAAEDPKKEETPAVVPEVLPKDEVKS